MKHTAAIVVRADKGFVELVRAMAAGVLKTLAVWVEKEIAGVEGQPDRQQTVVQVRDSHFLFLSLSIYPPASLCKVCEVAGVGGQPDCQQTIVQVPQ